MTHATGTSRWTSGVAAVLLGATGLVVAGAATTPAAAAATVSVDLYAVRGSTTLPGGQVVPVWGYCTRPPAAPTPGCNAAGTSVDAPGGPVLEATAGDTVQLTVHNELGVGSGLHVQGQPLPPDLTAVPDGGTRTYSFVADAPGTYLYEAGLVGGTQYQAAMGLHGALVVRPTTAGRAYDAASTTYDDEAVLVLSEIDPALNTSANPATFDLRKYHPRYTLINGRSHPDAAPIATQGGHTVLLRYVNAGLEYRSMGVLGSGQTFLALDGNPLAQARHYTAETIGPGQTADATVEAPAAARAAQSLSVYDASLLLHNGGSGGAGGMYTAVRVPADGSTDDTTGPVTHQVAFAAGSVSATADDTDHGGSDVAGAEYFVDQVGAEGSGTAMTGGFGSPTVDVGASGVDLGAGQHVVYVRSRDAGGHWGPLSSVLVTGADTGGPTVVGRAVAPRVTNGGSAVTVTATGDDSASGNTNVTGAEYFLDVEPQPADQGTGTAMTVASPAPVASLSATIAPSALTGLAEGGHTVWVEARDAQGNWGTPVSVALTVDRTGPVTSGLDASPNPSNGVVPLSASVPAVRLSATTMVDTGSSISRAEAFIDTVGSPGSGIPLTASDGLFNDLAEGGYLDIPLTTVRALANGPHTLHVRARDAAGNWGATASTTLLVDRTAPVASGVTLTPNPTAGQGTVALAASVTDAWTAPAAAEWFAGATDPGAGKATAVTGFASTGTGPYAVTGSLDVSNLSEGAASVKVRFRDQAGNWSAPTTVALTVRGPVFFSTLGNTNPPGVAGTADDADIYGWSGTAYSRAHDLTTMGVPASANVDGYDRVDATHFYLSFAADTTITGLGTVQDEDVVAWSNGTWSVWFDGTARGLTAANLDLDAISVAGGSLYFSTVGNTNPPGVTGTADDADVYRWDGTAFSRVVDATAIGLPAATNVDGLVWQDATHQYWSFAPDTTTFPGLGNVQDEDVVHRSGTVWAVYFDGTAHGLGTSGNLDVDAVDVP